jgi:hypothetical protein
MNFRAGQVFPKTTNEQGVCILVLADPIRKVRASRFKGQGSKEG